MVSDVLQCPPCRAFTPMLAKLYKKLTEDKKNVEVVFVSSDRSEESFGQYLDTMPWLAVPFGDPRIDQIKNLFAIDGIHISVTKLLRYHHVCSIPQFISILYFYYTSNLGTRHHYDGFTQQVMAVVIFRFFHKHNHCRYSYASCA